MILLCARLAFAADEQKSGWQNSYETAVRAFEEGRFAEALAGLDQITPSDAANALALDLRGCIDVEQGKLAEARQAFESAHTANRDLFGPRVHLADLSLQEGKWDEARDAYLSALRDTNILISSERLRYGMLLAALGAKDEAGAKTVLEMISFPSESAAYYYAQAAWAFAHDDRRGAEKWIRTAADVFKPRQTAWFAQPLHHLGWIKQKPPLVAESPW